MPVPQQFDPLLLDRLLSGSATQQEKAQIEAWIAQDPRNAAMLSALRDSHRVPAGFPADKTQVAWNALQTRIAAGSVRSISDAPSVRRKSRFGTPVLLRVAATLLVAVGGAALWRVQTAETTLVAPDGQRVSATLPDGSRMTLAAGSRATWPRRFGRGDREVTLEGEGYFDVVHDTTQPFRVRVGENVAEDVGTRFVVRAWPEIGGVEVSVEEGAVALGRDKMQPTLLAAGDRGRVTSDGRVSVEHDGAERAAWIRGEFVFDNTTLTDALPALGRWYGVTITASPELQSRRVTGRFSTLPLDPLLESLALALNAKINRAGSIITLSPQ